MIYVFRISFKKITLRQCYERRFNKIILGQCDNKVLMVGQSRVPISFFTSVENIWFWLPFLISLYIGAILVSPRGFQSQEVTSVGRSSRLLHSLKVFFFLFFLNGLRRAEFLFLQIDVTLYSPAVFKRTRVLLHGHMKSDDILFVEVEIISNDYCMHKHT